MGGISGDDLSPGEVTRLLEDVQGGDAGAYERLFPLVYGELRRLAGWQIGGERAGHTLQPTALVHEAYLKLAGPGEGAFESRTHFLRIAARAMRQVLVDHARRRAAEKRGGGRRRTTLSSAEPAFESDLEELVALDQALDALEETNSRLRQVVECKFFGGMTDAEVASVLGLSTKSVQRDWIKARAWLYRELYPDAETGGG